MFGVQVSDERCVGVLEPFPSRLEALKSPSKGRHVKTNGPSGPSRAITQLSKADLLTFWFSNFGPFLVEVPKG